MTSSRLKADDLLFGAASENRNISTLSAYFNADLKHNGVHAVLDWSDSAKTIFAELKTRRIKHDAYPTTLIGLNKVQQCTNPNTEYWFCYSYEDGLYTIKYDKALFDTFRVEQSYQRFKRADSNDNPSAVVHIPVKLLMKVDASRPIRKNVAVE
jgi:hypothetical protein